jgi:large repetitive protein
MERGVGRSRRTGTFAMALVITAAPFAMAPPAALAQPPTCGQVITEDTTLRSDLGPCPGDGLVIGARKVTLDLNGHAIVGDDTGDLYEGDIGVKGEGYARTVIKNGEIHDFFKSIKLDRADRSRVRDITDAGTNYCRVGPDVQVLRSRGTKIKHSVACAVQDGIGFVVSGSHSEIENNIASGQGVEGSGFKVSGFHNEISGNSNLDLGGIKIHGSRNRVRGNYVEGGELSIFLVEGARNRVARNSIPFIENGLQVLGPRNVIRKNVVGVAPDEAVSEILAVASDCRDVRVEDNVLHNGMLLSGCQNAQVEGNIVPSSGLYGIVLQGGSGSSIKHNIVSETPESGIFVGGGSLQTVVKGNLVTRGGSRGFRDNDDGIHVEDPGTTIADNRANDNADYGIQAVPGVIDGGGNTAVGNGNPLQCLNVVCS